MGDGFYRPNASDMPETGEDFDSANVFGITQYECNDEKMCVNILFVEVCTSFGTEILLLLLI